MQIITFECEIITPMFLSGADGGTPELRPPSIKGALRFWWRALNGHLPLKELKRIEGEIFGDTEKRSKVIIRIENEELITPKQTPPVPHKTFRKSAIGEGHSFKIILGILSNKILNIDQLKSLFILTCYLGGFGGRVRRGFGSVKVLKINNLKHVTTTKLNPILEWLNQCFYDRKNDFPKAEIDKKMNNSIKIQFGDSSSAYPYIKQIQIGEPKEGLLKNIGDTTHMLKKNNRAYEASLGHASNGRFASPIYVSALKDKGSLLPIITTLNAVPNPYNNNGANLKLQTNFKNKILKKNP